jgi:hypothetical protein
VAVLTHLGDQDARSSAPLLLEILGALAQGGKDLAVAVLCGVLVDTDDDVLALIDAGLPRAADSSIRILGMPDSMALAMPPISSTSSMIFWASRNDLVGQPFT